ncbi:hypothetical protein HYPSUDRAFT_895958 [Hypholoma sublateritium FD-334 SS-4]|uniref:Uncharacterized protein n=1 Tax=Hypholoma sublateritium (strain FD-334 SS-4) TaxID=945553 RepID=A0A0D2NKC7_HYPSF|nr:hypothetical protein HYPSUDRAFT_895958 [Hypholoma sublateritium FD-334 SS-4]
MVSAACSSSVIDATQPAVLPTHARDAGADAGSIPDSVHPNFATKRSARRSMDGKCPPFRLWITDSVALGVVCGCISRCAAYPDGGTLSAPRGSCAVASCVAHSERGGCLRPGCVSPHLTRRTHSLPRVLPAPSAQPESAHCRLAYVSTPLPASSSAPLHAPHTPFPRRAHARRRPMLSPRPQASVMAGHPRENASTEVSRLSDVSVLACGCAD